MTTVTTSPTTNGPGGELTRQLNQSHGSFEMVLSPIIMALAGWWLDASIGTGPWFTIVGAVFGLAGAVTKVWLDYRRKMDVHRADALVRREAAHRSAQTEVAA